MEYNNDDREGSGKLSRTNRSSMIIALLLLPVYRGDCEQSRLDRLSTSKSSKLSCYEIKDLELRAIIAKDVGRLGSHIPPAPATV